MKFFTVIYLFLNALLSFSQKDIYDEYILAKLQITKSEKYIKVGIIDDLNDSKSISLTSFVLGDSLFIYKEFFDFKCLDTNKYEPANCKGILSTEVIYLSKNLRKNHNKFYKKILRNKTTKKITAHNNFDDKKWSRYIIQKNKKGNYIKGYHIKKEELPEYLISKYTKTYDSIESYLEFLDEAQRNHTGGM